MPSHSPPNADGVRTGLWITLAVALAYAAWLGWHWLPLDHTDQELSASASRVWDVQRELSEHHRLPWWTPYFMSGSSYGLNHSRGLYLVPWMLLAFVTSLVSGGKLMALLAILAGALAMYGCARHFLRHAAAATLAAIVFLLHPEQLIRAAEKEAMTIILFFPFIPLLWWTFDRALQRRRFADIFLCSLVAVGAMWADNKQAVIQGVFLACYLSYRTWRQTSPDASGHSAPQPTPAPSLAAARCKSIAPTARVCAGLAGLSLLLGAFCIVPGLVESPHVKLFRNDPIESWQRNYSFKSLLGIVDRHGVITRTAVLGVRQRAEEGFYRPRTQAEADRLNPKLLRIGLLQTDAPEKYMGVILLALIAAAALWNRRRVDRRLFWFFIAMLLLCVTLATGPATVLGANLLTAHAIFTLDGVPGPVRLAWLLSATLGMALLALFFRRKITTPGKQMFAAGALALFLVAPLFRLLATLPYFQDIRAPYAFYDLPAVFFAAMLAGFFVTDLLAASPWRQRMPAILAAIGLLLLADYWPYQQPLKTNRVPDRTLANLRATYGALRDDPDWVKTYAFSARYFHLLGPMHSHKPQVYEAFYDWMAPRGIGLLNQHGAGVPALFNLTGARYIVVDRTDPGLRDHIQAILEGCRQLYPISLQNEDFVVFRNDRAWPYLAAHQRACLFVGGLEDSPRLALALADRDWPLVHAPQRRVTDVDPERLRRFEKIYVTGDDILRARQLPEDVRGKIVALGEDRITELPQAAAVPLALENVQLIREHAGLVRLRYAAPADCLLVVGESYYPFWTATLNGQPRDLLRISSGLMGIESPAGAHELVLAYTAPKSYAIAAGISLMTLLACAGLLILRRKPA
jgi:hypothetical protein